MCPQLVETKIKGGGNYLAENPTKGTSDILEALKDIDEKMRQVSDSLVPRLSPEDE